MLIFFMILCVIVLLPWTDGSLIFDGKLEIYKNAQAVPLADIQYIDKSHLSSTTLKAHDKDTVVKLKVTDFHS